MAAWKGAAVIFKIGWLGAAESDERWRAAPESLGHCGIGSPWLLFFFGRRPLPERNQSSPAAVLLRALNPCRDVDPDFSHAHVDIELISGDKAHAAVLPMGDFAEQEHSHPEATMRPRSNAGTTAHEDFTVTMPCNSFPPKIRVACPTHHKWVLWSVGYRFWKTGHQAYLPSRMMPKRCFIKWRRSSAWS